MDTASIQGTFRYSPKIQELRTLTLTIEHRTATILCFITIDQFESENLVRHMEPILFPPGESSTSVLAFTGGPNEYELAYRARSGAGSISILIAQVPAAVPRAAIDTLEDTGIVPILFGHIVGTDIAFMRPTLYALYRDSIVVNHETHGDAPRVVNWPLIMAEIEPELLVHTEA